MSSETLQRPACAFCNDAGVMASRDTLNLDPAFLTVRTWRRLCECPTGEALEGVVGADLDVAFSHLPR